MRRAALFSVLSLIGCGDGMDPSGMTVTVQKLELAETGDICYRSLSSKPHADLQLVDECTSGGTTAVHAGVDELRFVIDYGTGLNISDATVLPDPTIAVTLDGVVSTVAPSIGKMTTAGEHVYFLATYQVPLVVANSVKVSAEASPDYRDDAPAFASSLPAPSLRVQDCTESPCSMAGASGNVQVEVTVPARTGQKISLRTLVGGISDGSIREVTTAVTGIGITKAVQSIPVPPVERDSATWRIEATWLTESAAVDLEVTKPTIELEVEQCTSEPCSLVAGVGTARVFVTVPGDSPQTVDLRSVLGGITQTDSAEVTTAPIGQRRTRGSTTINVPFATDGAEWLLEATWRTYTARTPQVTLGVPAITASLECGSPCDIEAGSVVMLTVTAPKDIRANTAEYTTSPGPGSGTLTQPALVQAEATKVWRAPLTVPAQEGTWSVQASVGGYPAQTIHARIVAP